MNKLGKCNEMEFDIKLIDQIPFFCKQHHLSQHEWKLVDARCKELFEARLIRPLNSDFPTIMEISTKKDSNSLWMEKYVCKDYCALNAIKPI